MKSPIPFDPLHAALLGQPVILKTWFPTALVVCQCRSDGEPFLIVGETQTVCPRCRKAYVLAKITHVHGQPPQIVIGIVTGKGLPE